jgi:hypothetical protein
MPSKKWLQVSLSTSKEITHEKSEHSIHEQKNYDEDISYRSRKVTRELSPKNTTSLIHHNSR